MNIYGVDILALTASRANSMCCALSKTCPIFQP